MVDKRLTVFGTNAPATIEDQALQVHDIRATYSAFGEVLIASLSPKAAWRFDYGSTPNTRLYTATTANSGTATQANSEISLSSSTNTAGLARIQTQRRLRYLPGMGGLVRFTAAFDTAKANNTQIIGLGDTVDGFFFGYSGTNFSVGYRRNGADNFIAQADWNGDSVTFSPQLGNVYQIRYQWLGFGFIRFYILHPTNQAAGFILVHTIVYPNTSTATSILNPTLPLMAECSNAGNNTNIVLKSPSAAAFVEGVTSDPFNPLDVANAFDASDTFSDTANNHMLTIRNKSTFGGIANRVPVEIRGLNIARSASGSNTTTVRLYRNATTAGALTFADIDTNNSPVDASITATTITSTNPEYVYAITSNLTLQAIVFESNQLVLEPGESLTIGIQDGGVQGTDLKATINWIEKF